MATSPNYGWSEPDDSSLVRDGALAMRTLGNAIDTSVWNIGFGQAGKNKIINGNLDIWQRGTTFTTIGAGVYSADRWQIGAVFGTNSLTRQTTGVPVGSTYCLRFQGTMAGTLLPMQQIVESLNVKPMLGQSVTFSIKLRRNASFDQSLIIAIDKSATTDAAYGSTWTNISSTTVTNATLPTGTGSTDWYTASVTATIPSDGTANSIRVRIDHSATVANNGYYEFAQAMLETGAKATPFQTASGGSIQGELAMCQRYYQLIASGTSKILGLGFYVSTTGVDGPIINLPVEMRTTPTISIVTGTSYFQATSAGGGNDNLNSLTLAAESTNRTAFFYNNTEAAGTAGQGCRVQTNNAAAFLAVQAEL